jgi:molybdate transport system substrate-binding protein
MRPATTSSAWRAGVAAALALLVVAGCGGGREGGTGPAASGGDGGAITVAAASDLRFAFEELGGRFTEETGVEVTFSFGSSGQLREQIVNGAPFDVFASANVEFVDAVIEAGRGDPATKADYAIGRLALWSPPGVELPGAIDDLTDPRYERIAIANPEHAPYGLAAEQALATAGVLDAVRDRLVFGENISDTLRIARSGNADVGIVALSLAVADDAPYLLLDEELHEPLRQALVVTASGAGGDDARAFGAFVSSPTGREVMVRHGFGLPGEDRSA